MIEGTLIVESLRVGTNLTGLNLVVHEIVRYRSPDNTTDQPHVWTELRFSAEEADAEKLAQRLSDCLDQPGWYADFRSPAESFVAFPGRIFRYPRGDDAGRAQAQAHGRQLGIPEPQLDWGV